MPTTRRTLLIGAATGAAAMTVAANAAMVARRPVLRLKPWLDLAAVAGASWAVLERSGSIAHAAGDARAGETAATTETLFEAASLSKPVVAVAIHDLVREGRVDLDEPLARHVDFSTDPATRAITPRHLLSHASGLPNWRTEADSDLVGSFVPGSRFRYSGEGYVLLGRLIEAVTGRTAAEEVRTRVLMPAGMTHSTYGWTRGHTPAVAWPHDSGGAVMPDKGPADYQRRRDAGPPGPVETWAAADRIAAASALGKPALPIFMTPNMAAGLWTTASDYARFLAFARRYPAMNAFGVSVAGNLAWGLGWGLERAGTGRFAWHWGANDGVANLFVLDLDHGDGLVVLTNGAGGQRVYERAARTHFAREFDALTWLQP